MACGRRWHLHEIVCGPKKNDDGDERADARDQLRLLPHQVGGEKVARSQVLQVLFAILLMIQGSRCRATRTALFLLRVCLEVHLSNRLVDPSQLPCSSDASLRLLFVENGPLFIAFEVFAQVLEHDRVVEQGQGSSFACTSPCDLSLSLEAAFASRSSALANPIATSSTTTAITLPSNFYIILFNLVVFILCFFSIYIIYNLYIIYM